ncbi:hypothetical protein Pmani_027767 [Petrolisthes manimaculis]|uniref:Uncharacterized protein n=1 Tax=Petrolisthes manimaculis TaxID=1843537 RepID=A0AAE1P2U8_9EUCA|nr:hypothetical protein Pmani_027767 [Petrolisthes manimaculis]
MLNTLSHVTGGPLEKPRQLQRSSTDIITTSTQTDSPTTSLCPHSTLPQSSPRETQLIPPAPELALPGDSTSPAGPALSPRTSPPTPKSRNTTATISDNRSANPTSAYRKKTSVPLHQLGRSAKPATKEVVTTIDLTRQIQIHAHTLSHFCPCPPRGGPPPGSTATTTARGLDTRTTTVTGKTGCDHCYREGHTIDSCRSLSLLKKRHEKLCNQLTEQTAATLSPCGLYKTSCTAL